MGSVTFLLGLAIFLFGMTGWSVTNTGGLNDEFIVAVLGLILAALGLLIAKKPG